MLYKKVVKLSSLEHLLISNLGNNCIKQRKSDLISMSFMQVVKI